MSKEIDINNEEEILKECDFDYFYESENCSHELCMFYNDIQHQNADFNCKQAYIDLGRIAITLNKQSQRIAELEQQLKNAIVPKFKIGQEVWCVYEYWWNGKLADEPNKFAINNFIINAINIDKYGKHYIFHKKYEGRDHMICYRDHMICYQPNNFNGNRFKAISGVQNHCTDYYYLFATKEEAQAKLEELQGEWYEEHFKR